MTVDIPDEAYLMAANAFSDGVDSGSVMSHVVIEAAAPSIDRAARIDELWKLARKLEKHASGASMLEARGLLAAASIVTDMAAELAAK